jgi:hypothetical protein
MLHCKLTDDADGLHAVVVLQLTVRLCETAVVEVVAHPAGGAVGAALVGGAVANLAACSGAACKSKGQGTALSFRSTHWLFELRTVVLACVSLRCPSPA